MTQTELAMNAGLSLSQIQKMEAGKPASRRSWARVANAMKVPLDDIAPPLIATAGVDDREAHERLDDVMRDKRITVELLAKSGVPAEVTERLLAGGKAPEHVVRKLLDLLSQERDATWAEDLIGDEQTSTVLATNYDTLLAAVNTATREQLEAIDAAMRTRLAALTTEAAVPSKAKPSRKK